MSWKKIVLHQKIRQAVLERDGRMCTRCGDKASSKVELHVHHKDRNRENNDLSNLEVLCFRCHEREHHGKSLEIEKRNFISRIKEYGGGDIDRLRDICNFTPQEIIDTINEANLPVDKYLLRVIS